MDATSSVKNRILNKFVNVNIASFSCVLCRYLSIELDFHEIIIRILKEKEVFSILSLSLFSKSN